MVASIRGSSNNELDCTLNSKDVERNSMPHARRPRLEHPEVADIDVLRVLHALSDPTRLAIVRTLAAEPERACGTFDVDVAPSTLSHHFRVLREAGVIRQREDGARRWTTLRRADIDARCPGLLDAVLAATR
jgi:DNA-binding transcriptional ArsR family regulator